MCGGVFGTCINPWRPYDARNDIICSDHGLSHDHSQALILTNPDISLNSMIYFNETYDKKEQLLQDKPPLNTAIGYGCP